MTSTPSTPVAAGADIEAPGAVIGDGTPLADATAFGQWNAARRLIEHGAHSTFWESAALGLTDRVIKHCTDNHPTADDITASFWGACHGNQPDTAAYLLSRERRHQLDRLGRPRLRSTQPSEKERPTSWTGSVHMARNQRPKAAEASRRTEFDQNSEKTSLSSPIWRAAPSTAAEPAPAYNWPSRRSGNDVRRRGDAKGPLRLRRSSRRHQWRHAGTPGPVRRRRRPMPAVPWRPG